MSSLGGTDRTQTAARELDGASRTVLFLRNFRQLSGGHLKVWHYFNHVAAMPGFSSVIAFSSESVWDETNPWIQVRHETLSSFRDLRPDILFVDGRDWIQIDEAGFDYRGIPVINFVQGVRHSHPERRLYSFLERRALRICVSDEVESAIMATGRVNGPTVVIRNGLEMQPLLDLGSRVSKDTDLLIVAMKQPELGRALYERLRSCARCVELLDTRIPREQFLQRLAEARTAVFLPHWQEGFYLPALEAMALGTLAVCPDCIGNRSFCRPGHNCFRPAYNFDAIIADVRAAVGAAEAERERLFQNGRRTLNRHTLAEEREAFKRVLLNLDELWRR